MGERAQRPWPRPGHTRASGPALAAAGEFPGSSSHAELCRQRGGGRQVPGDPARLQGCPRTHPPRQSSRGGDPIVRRGRWAGTGAGCWRAHFHSARSPPLRGSDPILGARTGTPPRTTRGACLPPLPQLLFQPRTAPGPSPPPAGAPPPGAEQGQADAQRGARPGRRARVGSPRPWAALAGLATKPRQDGPCASSWHSQSAPAAPGACGAWRFPARPTHPPRVHLRPARAPGQPCGAGRGGGGCRRPPVRPAASPPSPGRHSPAHLPRRRAAATAAARPPSLRRAMAALPRGPAAAPRGPGGPGGSARPGLGGPGSGEARRTHSRRRHRAASRMSHPARAERDPPASAGRGPFEPRARGSPARPRSRAPAAPPARARPRSPSPRRPRGLPRGRAPERRDAPCPGHREPGLPPAAVVSPGAVAPPDKAAISAQMFLNFY